ncbi:MULTISPECIES: alpha/beta fold hydrolase [unclassified Streptomyces]|uniref:alpha/beta fold hydrolase n=1 Tax=unclassified Streptomyces TaxID=2593676 RepID=UPI001BE93E86|nr:MULTISPECIES: alpha/beta hydrolase [unclassified Streptomyces]MBT2408329.1 alpha/beta hydrolase [Streptomyces sp. ISL-21]MBT2611732.1 alpha/beta hydrolase [Streptomyces sp. ISL-87]
MRQELKIDDRTLSYLDFGGPGRPLLALHGGLSEAAAFTGLAEALGDEWRVIAPDQRGHGDSDRAADYSREGYVADSVALLDHLGLDAPVAVLGYSLGGLNAYHLAAAHPERVHALIDVDATVEIDPRGGEVFDFLRAMKYTAATREELLDAAGPVGAQFVAPALRPLPGGEGWRLPFHPQDMLDSVEQCRGDHWDAWLASSCPALVIHGTRSQALPQATADTMVSRRPGTTYTPFDADHFLPFTDPAGFHEAVRKFLAAL